jgi:aminotransferase
VWVDLHAPDWSIDEPALRKAFSKNTKAIIVNTPNNPTGKVFSRNELDLMAELCQEHDAYAITDEIYEHIIYTDAPHVSLATLPGMAERTITISGLSKTFSCTGWRLGYCLASPEITGAIRKVHDFLTVGAPHPLQVAATVAYSLPMSYYDTLREDYRRRRGILLGYLREAGFEFHDPDGAYYVMTDIRNLGGTHDVEFVQWLVKEIGVAGVPGSSFYHPPERGRTKVRFMWAKRDATLHEAGKRLRKLAERR